MCVKAYLNQKLLKELKDSIDEKNKRIIKILHDIQNPVYSINISLNNEVNNSFDDSSIEKSKSNI